MEKINLCLGHYRKELAEWLDSRYEVTTEIPHERFKLCFIDFDSIDTSLPVLRECKENNPDLFLPVVLVCNKGEVNSIIKQLDGIVDEVLLEPVEIAELRLRTKTLLNAATMSARTDCSYQNEMKLELQAQRLANLSENVPGMIYQFAVFNDGSTRFEYISSGCKDIFEIDPQQAIKDPLFIISTVHPHERAQFQKELTDAIREKRSFYWEGRYLIDHKIKWLRVASTPHKTDYAMVWDGVMIDITRLKQTEGELITIVKQLQKKNEELTLLNSQLDRANEKLRGIDKAKTKFISTAAHEIRTPLTSILGFVQTILSPDIQLPDPSQKEYLKIVESETKRLSNLVKTMLDISRLDAGRQELHLSRFDITERIYQIKSTISSEVKGEIFFTIIVKSVDTLVCADAQQITLVIRNLLDNAMRYTQPGDFIEITVDRNNDEVVVAIRDNGPGIPPDKLEAVFEKFYRIRKDTSASGRGSGLGLPISKEIIKAHRGSIWAESSEGRGSTFKFTLPADNNIKGCPSE